MFYERRYSATCLARRKGCPVHCNGSGTQCPKFVPDFVKVAKSFGVAGIRVTKSSEVKTAIQKALKTKGPVLVDFHVEEEENVFPMVPAGEAINRMIGGMA